MTRLDTISQADRLYKAMVLLIVSVLLGGCGSGAMSIKHNVLTPHVEEFFKDAQIFGANVEQSNISYHIAEAPLHKDHPQAVGLCFRGEVSSFILISRQYWNKAEDVEKKALMYHELAHCALYKGHDYDPASIMFPYVHSAIYLGIHLDDMIEELFTEGEQHD